MGQKRERRSGNGRAPDPLTPADCSLSGYPSIIINIARLRQSDFDATTDDTAWRAGVNLWFSAWESVPAGSLRADDVSLARAAMLGRDVRTWGRVKDVALHGFVLCSDGRLYHRTLCAIALGNWIDKLIRRHAGQRGNRGERPQQQREAELRVIERQLSTAADRLAALDPLAPALGKAAKVLSQSDRNAVAGRSAMQPQGNGRERDQEKSPDQEQARIIPLGGGAR